MSLDEARQRLGELFIVGFEGQSLSEDTMAFLSQAGVGGVILFSRNYSEPKQLAELINQVQDCRGELPLWVSTDQEGGRVQRFKEPFTLFPSAEKVAQTGSPKIAFEVAQALASEIRAMGVNMNFSPCVDIFTNPENTVIGDRSYGKTPEEVTKFATAIVRGHVTAGVQPCVKHFPGHGDTKLDSHDALPEINRSVEELKARELVPFIKTFKSRCNMVMTAHIRNSALDPDFPATLSQKTIREFLRKELRYSKVVISDDLEMKAITEHYGEERVPVLAVQAGCDLLIYRSENAARHAYESLSKALVDGEISPDQILEASSRSRQIKKDFLMPYEAVKPEEVASKIGLEEHKKLLESIPKT